MSKYKTLAPTTSFEKNMRGEDSYPEPKLDPTMNSSKPERDTEG
jgi:hypothetical protein